MDTLQVLITISCPRETLDVSTFWSKNAYIGVEVFFFLFRNENVRLRFSSTNVTSREKALDDSRPYFGYRP